MWTVQEQAAFQALKTALVQAPVLALPDFTKTFVLETDACDKGIGAVLMQMGHPIAFLSRALGPKNQALSTYEKECLAILMAVDKWRSYLQHQEFVIHTDQRSLVHLGDQKLCTPMQQKAYFKLLGLQYKVAYKAGLENKAADALSRHPKPAEVVLAMSMVKPKWLNVVVGGYFNNPRAQKLLAELSIHSPDANGYSLVDGVIRFKNRIWLGHHQEAQQAVMMALHDSGVGGHSGQHATYHKIKALFVWSGMKKDIYAYVQQCVVCQQAKGEHVRPPGLLQPLPIPKEAWHTICMDFIEGLPTSQSFNCILVVIDKFSKYGHFIPLKHPFTAFKIAQVFVDNVYKLHGMPSVIISDRDKIFTSTLWQEFFKLMDVKMNMSSSYHPQTDGQTERLNQCLESYLRCLVHANPKQWAKWLPHAEFWYNSSYHTALGRTPFEVLYGRSPKHFGIQLPSAQSPPDLNEWLQARSAMLEQIRHHLQRAQQRMKYQADKHRSEREFQVGDKVFLRLQPYVQQSVAQRSAQKLCFRYFGPYTILQRVGKVAYKLQLPPSSQIHPVVHVSQLKKFVPPSTEVYATLPVYSLTDSRELYPTAVKAYRFVHQGAKIILQGRILWTSTPPLLTWENLDAMIQRYPESPAWGQAVAKGGGDVMIVGSAQANTEAEKHSAKEAVSQ